MRATLGMLARSARSAGEFLGEGSGLSVTGTIRYATTIGAGTWDSPTNPIALDGATVDSDIYSRVIFSAGDVDRIAVVHWYTKLDAGEWTLRRDNDLSVPYTPHPYAPSGIPRAWWADGSDGAIGVRATIIFDNAETQNIDATFTLEEIAVEEPPPPTPISGDIRDYMTQAGGQLIVVPDGYYVWPDTVTQNQPSVSCPHAFAAGATYKGWLVLEAQTEGGVTIDLQGKSLNIETASSRVLFIGFNFINGRVNDRGCDRIRYWYCDFTYPAGVWWEQYLANGNWNAGYDPYTGVHAGCNHPPSYVKKPGGHARPARPSLTAGMIDVPIPFYSQQFGSSLARNIKIYGCDIHDCVDDGWSHITGGLKDSLVVGCQVWNIDKWAAGDPGEDSGLWEEGGLVNWDPGGSLNSNQKDWYHNDGIATHGVDNNRDIADSFIGQKLHIETQHSTQTETNCNYTNIWLAGSTHYGFIAAIPKNPVDLGKMTSCTMDNVRWFGNGIRPNNRLGYDDAKNNLGTTYHGTATAANTYKQYPTTWHVAGAFELVITNVDSTVPSGIDVTDLGGGKVSIDDIMQVVEHAENPANIWRAANPYSSWATYFASLWD